MELARDLLPHGLMEKVNADTDPSWVGDVVIGDCGVLWSGGRIPAFSLIMIEIIVANRFGPTMLAEQTRVGVLVRPPIVDVQMSKFCAS